MSEDYEKIKELTLVDFDKNYHTVLSEYKFVKKNWGTEHWIVNTDKYCMKILSIAKGRMCSVHYHKIKDETFHVVQGFIRLELWHNVDLITFDVKKPNNIMTLWPGSAIRIQPRTAHRFYGIQASQMIEVSTTHSDDSVRLIPSPPYGA